MLSKPNVLVVCGRNKRRSRTAEYMFKNDQRFNIRSVGLSPRSLREIKAKDVEWSNIILVMDDEQSSQLKSQYKSNDIPVVEVLGIEDTYEYLNLELQEILRREINTSLAQHFEL